ncbi:MULTISPECIES: hypothetical protein [unclassified Xanthomonas]|uniref:hypothetical protein n=1 Tax=unclassified Xanthomonas TaxID=2643310 RepID=UPI002A7EDAEC|nr:MULTISPECIES: hypothetical protein [unclassified Xanthomonas]MDY4296830.1 hypothetical protein [Xanthomonas sp. LF02-5]MDY4358411.1 hypothetical protein [Xanthomonas sp. LF04-12]
MSDLRISVDAGGILDRQFGELERAQMPFALMQACNATAFEVREAWKRKAPQVFDRPTPMTVNAAMYRKATKDRLYAEIFLRDEAFKGTPPSKYLLAEVAGGQRRVKGFEALLQAKGLMPRGEFAVTGRGAATDQYGNVRGSQITAILSQLSAQRDAYQNQSDVSAKRRRAKRKRGGNYFVVMKKRGRLRPGIYERIDTGFGSAVRSIFVFTRRATYRPRYDIFGLAQRTWEKLMPFYFEREMVKAMQSAMARGGE